MRKITSIFLSMILFFTSIPSIPVYGNSNPLEESQVFATSSDALEDEDMEFLEEEFATQGFLKTVAVPSGTKFGTDGLSTSGTRFLLTSGTYTFADINSDAGFEITQNGADVTIILEGHNRITPLNTFSQEAGIGIYGNDITLRFEGTGRLDITMPAPTYGANQNGRSGESASSLGAGAGGAGGSSAPGVGAAIGAKGGNSASGGSGGNGGIGPRTNNSGGTGSRGSNGSDGFSVSGFNLYILDETQVNLQQGNMMVSNVLSHSGKGYAYSNGFVFITPIEQHGGGGGGGQAGTSGVGATIGGGGASGGAGGGGGGGATDTRSYSRPQDARGHGGSGGGAGGNAGISSTKASNGGGTVGATYTRSDDYEGSGKHLAFMGKDVAWNSTNGAAGTVAHTESPGSPSGGGPAWANGGASGAGGNAGNGGTVSNVGVFVEDTATLGRTKTGTIDNYYPRGMGVEAPDAVALYNLEKATVTFDESAFVYDGTDQIPSNVVVTVEGGSGPIVVPKELYEIEVVDPSQAGNAKELKVVAKPWDGTSKRTAAFESVEMYAIEPKEITPLATVNQQNATVFDNIQIDISEFTLPSNLGGVEGVTLTKVGGSGDARVVRNADGEIELELIKAGSIEYEAALTYDNNHRGPATIKIPTILVEQKSVEDLNVSYTAISNYEYNGLPNEPTSTIEYKGMALVEGTDFTVEYQNNQNAGTGTVIFKGINNYKDEKSFDFTITPAVISDALVGSGDLLVDMGGPYTFTGEQILADVALSWDGLPNKHIYKSDFKVDIQTDDTINSGVVDVILRGNGNVVGEVSTSYTIQQRNIADASVMVLPLVHTYSSLFWNPVPIVRFGGLILEEGIDFTTGGYQNNLNAGNGTFELSGRGQNFTGTRGVGLSIRPYELSNQELESNALILDLKGPYVYTGDVINPGVSGYELIWSDKTKTLAPGDHRLKVVGNSVDVGTVEVTIEGASSNVIGSLTSNFEIEPRTLSGSDITVSKIPDYEYNGKAYEPKVDLTYEKSAGVRVKLVEGRDFEIQNYIDNKNHGTGYVTVKGKGNWKDELQVPFQIKKSVLSDSDVAKGSIQIDFEPIHIYTGKAIKPEVSMRWAKDGTQIPSDDYDVVITSMNNTDAGSGIAMEIRGTGVNLEGIIHEMFDIVPKSLRNEDVDGVIIDRLENLIFNGEPQVLEPQITYHELVLEEGKDYQIVHNGNQKEPGDARITVRGSGNYQGEVILSYQILKKSLTIVPSKDLGKSEGTIKEPELIYTIEGEVSGYPVTLRGNLIRELGEGVGDYPILIGSLSIDPFSESSKYYAKELKLEERFFTIESGNDIGIPEELPPEEALPEESLPEEVLPEEDLSEESPPEESEENDDNQQGIAGGSSGDGGDSNGQNPEIVELENGKIPLANSILENGLLGKTVTWKLLEEQATMRQGLGENDFLVRQENQKSRILNESVTTEKDIKQISGDKKVVMSTVGKILPKLEFRTVLYGFCLLFFFFLLLFKRKKR